VALTVGLLLWLAGTVVSDLVADTDRWESIKGVLRVTFLATSLAATWYIVKGRRPIIRGVWWGLVVAGVSSFFFYPSPYAAGEPWKFGIGIPVTLVVALLLTHRRVPGGVVTLAFGALAALHFVLGFRSMAIVCMVVALLFLVRARAPVSGPRALPRLLGAGVVGALLATAMVLSYDGIARSGALGELARSKSLTQANGELGSLLSGRSDALLALRQIAETPVFGAGSHPRTGSSAAEETAQLYANWGYSDVASRYGAEPRAFHSELLGSWAQNGIAALPFWIAVAVLLGWAVLFVVARRTELSPLVAFVAVLGLWDLLFSPFGADRRFWLAASLVLVLVCVDGPWRRYTPWRPDGS
jgi:hypothetical protein